jgi:uncharacterized peroxidase-related enzyme
VRLGVLERGHQRPARLFIRLVELASRQRMDNVVLTVLHRPEFWGRSFSALVNDVIRGPSFWTPGEREFLAMTVSRLNECPFCLAAHTETTRLESRGEVAVDGGAMRPELAAVLPFLEKVTTAPDTVTADDAALVRARGVPDEAIVDALHVALVFDMVNRMANAFGWSWNSDRHVHVAAVAIHRMRYKLPGFVTRSSHPRP